MQTVVITGSTRGIGKGLALEFLKRGHNVTINGTTKTGVQEVLESFSKYKSQLLGIPGDVSKNSTHEKLFDLSKDHFGKVDIYINNAGISTPNIATSALDHKEIKHLYDINIKGMTYGTLLAYRKMQEQGHGQIFNMEGFGSDGRMRKKMTIYGTSKYALTYFTKSMAKEAKNTNVMISRLSPGMVITDLLMDSIKDNPHKEQEQAKRIFNILGEKVEKVCPYLVEKILKSKKNNDHIAYLSGGKILWRFFKSIFVKRNLFDE